LRHVEQPARGPNLTRTYWNFPLLYSKR
jgi:hypothetical protein